MTRGLLIWESALAGLQVIAGATALLALMDARWSGLIVVVVAAMQAATATYKRGLATPVSDGLTAAEIAAIRSKYNLDR